MAKNYVDISEILAHAEEIGYTKSQADRYIWNAEIQPMYEVNKRPWSLSDFDDEDEFEEDTIKIMRSFFASIGKTEIIVLLD